MASPPAKYPEQLIFMAPTETRERVERIATKDQRSLSDVIREAVERGLEYLEA